MTELKFNANAVLNYGEVTGGDFFKDISNTSKTPLVIASMAVPNTAENMRNFLASDDFNDMYVNGLFEEANNIIAEVLTKMSKKK